ncbi:MAG: hypothetical protein H6698_05840 [Myxococcales bacterium]|nr:hypothetical protein [Myxococcales bacterium]MCB9533826.1 hypothetical protein [Myxococcales bacterium]
MTATGAAGAPDAGESARAAALVQPPLPVAWRGLPAAAPLAELLPTREGGLRAVFRWGLAREVHVVTRPPGPQQVVRPAWVAGVGGDEVHTAVAAVRDVLDSRGAAAFVGRWGAVGDPSAAADADALAGLGLGHRAVARLLRTPALSTREALARARALLRVGAKPAAAAVLRATPGVWLDRLTLEAATHIAAECGVAELFDVVVARLVEAGDRAGVAPLVQLAVQAGAFDAAARGAEAIDDNATLATLALWRGDLGSARALAAGDARVVLVVDAAAACLGGEQPPRDERDVEAMDALDVRLAASVAADPSDHELRLWRVELLVRGGRMERARAALDRREQGNPAEHALEALVDDVGEPSDVESTLAALGVEDPLAALGRLGGNRTALPTVVLEDRTTLPTVVSDHPGVVAELPGVVPEASAEGEDADRMRLKAESASAAGATLPSGGRSGSATLPSGGSGHPGVVATLPSGGSGHPGVVAKLPSGGSGLRLLGRVTSRLRAIDTQHTVLWRDGAEVADELDAIAVRDPRDPFALTYAGELRLWLGEYEEAADRFARACRLSNARWGYIGLGAALSLLGRGDEAVATWDAGVARLEYEATWTYLGELLLARGDVAGAGVHLAQAVRTRPDRLGAWVGYGRWALAAGDAPAAENAAAEVARRAPALWAQVGGASGAAAGADDALFAAALAALRGNRSSHLYSFFGADGVWRCVRPGR